MEAEEYALFFNGFQIKAVSDPATCDFITTTPNSYYILQPGVTARVSGEPREVAKFDCTDVALQNFAGIAVPLTFGANASPYTTLNHLRQVRKHRWHLGGGFRDARSIGFGRTGDARLRG
jgi:hypothetical protein